MKRDEKLYNVLFPLWFLLLVPISWLIVIPANFVIDLLALLLAMKLLRMPDIGKNLKSAVLKSWLAGFAADLIGGGAMFLSVLAGEFLPDPVRSWVYHNITEAVMVNPFSSVGGFLWTAVCVALAGGIIYLLNLKFCLKKTTLDLAQKRKLALAMALVTAPYLFFVPTALLYR
ncbi:MAG TPA: hypothetical protein IAB55_11155 [Candidatus Merdivicinus faecavium]|nr:hypothetical protein [Candidatus Merdivicinus faecavium]